MVPIIKAIASALEAAHKAGVVHREVRPDNIFVANVTGYEQGFLKLLDFGVSRLNAGPSPGSNLATTAARYLAPEQARGHAAEVDARTDQYALAALAYRMLSGTDAFGGNDVISVLYRVLNEAPRSADRAGPGRHDVDSIIRKAMSRDKRLRFDSVFVFAKALEDAASGNSRVVSRPVPVATPAPAPRAASIGSPAPARGPRLRSLQPLAAVVPRLVGQLARAASPIEGLLGSTCPRSPQKAPRRTGCPSNRPRRATTGGQSETTGKNDGTEDDRRDSRPVRKEKTT